MVSLMVVSLMVVSLEDAAMPKRIIAAIIGTLAIAAGIVACGFGYEAAWDFRSPEASFWSNAFGTLLMGTMAFGGFVLGIRLLRLARSGVSQPLTGTVSAIFLGLACFFPGFVFSLPVTILWARHKWPGDGQSDLGALGISCLIGVAAAVVGCAVLLNRRRTAAIQKPQV